MKGSGSEVKQKQGGKSTSPSSLAKIVDRGREKLVKRLGKIKLPSGRHRKIAGAGGAGPEDGKKEEQEGRREEGGKEKEEGKEGKQETEEVEKEEEGKGEEGKEGERKEEEEELRIQPPITGAWEDNGDKAEERKEQMEVRTCQLSIRGRGEEVERDAHDQLPNTETLDEEVQFRTPGGLSDEESDSGTFYDTQETLSGPDPSAGIPPDVCGDNPSPEGSNEDEVVKGRDDLVPKGPSKGKVVKDHKEPLREGKPGQMADILILNDSRQQFSGNNVVVQRTGSSRSRKARISGYIRSKAVQLLT